MTARLLRYLAATLLVLAAAWLRMHDLTSMPPGLSSDESMNVNDAFHLQRVGPARFPYYENYGEPEPLYRFLLSAFVPLVGPHVATFRIISAFVGTLTVAAAFWTARQALSGYPARTRWSAGLLAAGALAAAVGHLTLSRSLYRAVLLPLSILLFTGFLLRGMRRRHWGDIALSGLFLGTVPYTYSSGFVIPFALLPFALGLSLFERRSWKFWAPALALIVAIAAVLLAPVGYILAQNPGRVFGRAAEVTSTSIDTGTLALTTIAGRLIDTSRSLLGLNHTALFVSGDVNPQYNSALAPIVPPLFQPLFALGILMLLWQWRRPQSWLLLPLLFIATAPAVMTVEPLHGLRISSVYALLPIGVGLGAGLAWTLAARLPERGQTAAALGAAALLVTGLAGAWQTYSGYWRTPPSIVMYDRDLSYGEWYFRSDQRDLALWISAQQGPMLVPVDQLILQTVHGWLLPLYPSTEAAGMDFTLPPGTRLVVPWLLELGDYHADARHYALLHDHTITLLPPLSPDTLAALAAGLDSAPHVDRPNGAPLAKVVTPEAGFRYAFETPQVSASLDQPIAALSNGLLVTRWWGPVTLPADQAQTVTYTVEWSTLHPQRHDYRSFVGLLTHNNERKAGVDGEMTRWLRPPWTWPSNTPTPVNYTFTVPAGLDPGAYRLAVIMQDDLNTIGWVKVPQALPPAPDSGRVTHAALFNGEFTLYGASAQDEGGGNIRVSLFWQSNVERPLTDAIIFVHAQDSAGTLIAQTDAQPWQGQYPTFIWSQGERIQTDYVLSLGETPAAEVEIWAGMYTFPSLQRLGITQEGVPVKDSRLRVGSLVELLGPSPSP